MVCRLAAMLRFRMFRISRHYKQADDCDALRTDHLFKLVVDQAPPGSCRVPALVRLKRDEGAQFRRLAVIRSAGSTPIGALTL